MVTSREVEQCVCVEGGGGRGGGREVLASLNANEKLKAYLQCVIPAAQLGFSLRQDQQQKVTAPALLAVTEVRNTKQRVCLCVCPLLVFEYADSASTAIVSESQQLTQRRPP